MTERSNQLKAAENLLALQTVTRALSGFSTRTDDS